MSGILSPAHPGVNASLLHTSRKRMARFRPVGAFENSPAVHCWVNGRREPAHKSRRDGRTARIRPSLRALWPPTLPNFPSDESLGYCQTTLRVGTTGTCV